MPIFEFACNDCSVKRFSELIGVVQEAAPIQCPKCGSQNVRKLVSRFSRLRSEDEALDSLADLAEGADENDPKAMRRLMHEVASGMGDDMSTDELEEIMEGVTAPDEGGEE